MFAVSLALIAQEFAAGRERGTAMGIYGATIGIAVAIGPLVGGALTDGLGWESIFYLNVPIGVAAIAITQLKLRESRDPNATRIDWAGRRDLQRRALPARAGARARQRRGLGQHADRLAVRRRRRACSRPSSRSSGGSREPMLPLGLFRRRAFTGVQLAAFAVSGSLFALFLYMTLYLQNYLGYSPLRGGPALPADHRRELPRRADRRGCCSRASRPG